MKIVFKTAELQKATHILQSVVSTKSTLPILSNILLETKFDTTTLTATDLEVGVSLTIDAKAEVEGATTIPAKKFCDIIREMTADEIIFTAKKNNVITIESGKSFFKIIGLPKEEFPKIPEFKNKDVIKMSEKLLKTMLGMTYFAVSRDEARYVLNGILFNLKDGSLRLAATDGRRLALIERDIAVAKNAKLNAIVPSKAIYELLKILSGEGDASVIFEENHVLFEVGNVRIISRLIEGEFPRYEQVIPKEAKEKMRISRDEFMLATKRASLFTTPDSQAIRMDVNRNKATISKTAQNLGEVKEDLDAEYKGDDLTIGFNPTYLLDVLKNMTDEEISIELTSPDKPAVIRTQDKYVYVVLPMQLA